MPFLVTMAKCWQRTAKQCDVDTDKIKKEIEDELLKEITTVMSTKLMIPKMKMQLKMSLYIIFVVICYTLDQALRNVKNVFLTNIWAKVTFA